MKMAGVQTFMDVVRTFADICEQWMDVRMTMEDGCFTNFTTPQEQNAFFEHLRDSLQETVYLPYHGTWMLPMAVMGLVLTTLYLLISCKAIRKRRVSRKCYVLLINRTIGDIMSCLAAFTIALYIVLGNQVNHDLIFLFETLFTGSFWSALISYTSLSMLKLYAIWRPFDYRRTVTMKRCIYLGVVSWFLFGCYCIGSAMFGTRRFGMNTWIGCTGDLCQMLMHRFMHFFTVTIYVLTILVFIVTVLLIRRARAFSFRAGESSTTAPALKNFPLWKLGVHILTFAGLSIFFIVCCMWNAFSTGCYFQRNYVELMRIRGIVRLILILRICLDPVLSFATDLQLRRCLFETFSVTSEDTSSTLNHSKERKSDTTHAGSKK